MISMDSTTVNWTVLDTLVLDYAEAEQLLDNTNENFLGNFAIRHIIERIRRLIEDGLIMEALDMIRQHAPSVLDDQRLLFRMYKQNFVELLRTGFADSGEKALQCLRTLLGPCALNAYPEAYEEFKRILLVLVYNKEDESSPVVEEWSELRRGELAATVASVLRAQLHAYDPLFSLSLRYLISTHNSYCLRQVVASPIAQMADMVLLKERDPPATPHESLLEAPKFSEGDVQALAHAVELPRQAAVDSLRYTGGDLLTAFKNELSRMKLNINLVDELVREYCIYRGLIDCSTRSMPCKGLAGSMTSNLNFSTENRMNEALNETITDIIEATTKETTMAEVDPVICQKCLAGGDCGVMMHLDYDSGCKVFVKDNESTAKSFVECSCSRNLQLDIMMEAPPIKENILVNASDESAGHSCQTTSSPCSISCNSILNELKNRASRKRIGPYISCRKWQGRQGQSRTEQLQKLPVLNLHCDHVTSTPLGDCESKEIKITIEEEMRHQELDVEKYRILLEIRGMVYEGMTSEVIEEVKQLIPGFFECHPSLLFQLKQVEFLKLVEDGDYTQALGIARADMGPLAAKHSDLLKPLKETLFALSRSQGDPPVKLTPPSMLGAALQAALSVSLGIAEPSLMKIMRTIIYAHTEWFKLQMCSDPFAELLSINALKETELSKSRSSISCSKQDSNSGISSSITGSTVRTHPSEGSTSQQLESYIDVTLFDEMAILTVMEWMALPRGDAIQLLAQYDGSVDNVFAHILS
eukprot:c24623_g1_i2 orf=259-2529(-)